MPPSPAPARIAPLETSGRVVWVEHLPPGLDFWREGVAFRFDHTVCTDTQLRAIAEQKLPDLNANTIEQAEKIVAGTARSMGVEIK